MLAEGRKRYVHNLYRNAGRHAENSFGRKENNGNLALGAPLRRRSRLALRKSRSSAARIFFGVENGAFFSHCPGWYGFSETRLAGACENTLRRDTDVRTDSSSRRRPEGEQSRRRGCRRKSRADCNTVSQGRREGWHRRIFLRLMAEKDTFRNGRDNAARY